MEKYEKEMSFEELLNNSMKDIRVGQIVTGKIIDFSKNKEVFVDIGYKSDGIIPISEYSYEENSDPKEELKIGDVISAEVLKLNDGVGNVLLSYKRLKDQSNRKIFEEKVNNDEIFEEKISGIIDKGFVVNYNGIRIFIPISLSGITRTEDIKDYAGKTVKFKIVEYDPLKRKIIGSVKIVNDQEKENTLKYFWDTIEVGKQMTGKVVSLSSYGAFVDLGGVQGLLHVSEMSWSRNAVASEILKIGQMVNVSVKVLDKENSRISLTLIDKGINPWENIEKRYNINDIITVSVTKLMPFGAFVELESGIEGLVHISQITGERITKPDEKLEVGQKVNAKIINIDSENKKIELSIKDLEGTSNEYIEE